MAALLSIPRREEGDTTTAPSYELMFEGGQGTPAPTPPADTAPPPTPAPPAPDLPQTPSEPPPPQQPDSEVLPGPETPAPESPPDPAAPEQPPPATAEPAPELTLPPVPTPAEPLPAPPAPAPPAPAQTAPTPPAPAPAADVPDLQAPPAATTPPEPAPEQRPPDVRLDLPQTPAPPPPLPDLATPAPAPPAPPPPPPRPRPRTAPPPGTFGNPMDLSFNSAPSRAPAPRVTAPRGSVASRSLDLSPGVPKGPDRSDMFFDARAARIGGDWREALKTYWVNHRYYPRQAAENGEDGSVDVELTVGGNGRVQSVVLKSRSGSTFIDMAAVGTWRNAQLPPLPPELGNPYTFTITINYILLR